MSNGDFAGYSVLRICLGDQILSKQSPQAASELHLYSIIFRLHHEKDGSALRPSG